eukprot:CAMPEP_0169467062 /NCGR_PEP_ID=MMETSP1042-20121227/22121_1 /TAXON_ID=464988 /ORGANISM="Hemiselmis andersenii, Strain CCMP1180" /LENGTH=84 /DNA_ID=CAMNT_0009580197 /DNA_START=285 /DNA_END=539 /DNA_ORIENTATION=-
MPLPALPSSASSQPLGSLRGTSLSGAALGPLPRGTQACVLPASPAANSQAPSHSQPPFLPCYTFYPALSSAALDPPNRAASRML